MCGGPAGWCGASTWRSASVSKRQAAAHVRCSITSKVRRWPITKSATRSRQKIPIEVKLSHPRKREKKTSPPRVQTLQRAALLAPIDVGDPPAGVELDQIKLDADRPAEILEFDRSNRLTGGLAQMNGECVDVPFLRVDERVAVEHRHFVAFLGGLHVLDDQRGQRWLKITADRGLIGQWDAAHLVGIALVGGIDAVEKLTRGQLGRLCRRPRGDERKREKKNCRDDPAPCDHARSDSSCYGSPDDSVARA